MCLPLFQLSFFQAVNVTFSGQMAQLESSLAEVGLHDLHMYY